MSLSSRETASSKVDKWLRDSFDNDSDGSTDDASSLASFEGTKKPEISTSAFIDSFRPCWVSLNREDTDRSESADSMRRRRRLAFEKWRVGGCKYLCMMCSDVLDDSLSFGAHLTGLHSDEVSGVKEYESIYGSALVVPDYIKCKICGERVLYDCGKLTMHLMGTHGIDRLEDYFFKYVYQSEVAAVNDFAERTVSEKVVDRRDASREKVDESEARVKSESPESSDAVSPDKSIASSLPSSGASSLTPVKRRKKRKRNIRELCQENQCVFTCPNCEKQLRSLGSLRNHLKTTHRKRRLGTEFISKYVSVRVDHACRLCGELVLQDKQAIGHHVGERHRDETTPARYLAESTTETATSPKREAKAESKPADILGLSSSDAIKKEAAASPKKLTRQEILAKARAHRHRAAFPSRCTFRCRNVGCLFEALSWSNLARHCLNKHKLKVHLNESETLVVRRETHRCRLCGEDVLQDNSIMSHHLKSKHKRMSIKEYVRKRAKKVDSTRDYDSRSGDEDISKAFDGPSGCDADGESGAVTSAVSDLCEFSCVYCDALIGSWQLMEVHVADTHGKGYGCDARFVRVRVRHRCALCYELVLCDRTFIARHVRVEHKLTLQQYEERHVDRGREEDDDEDETKLAKVETEDSDEELEIENVLDPDCFSSEESESDE